MSPQTYYPPANRTASAQTKVSKSLYGDDSVTILPGRDGESGALMLEAPGQKTLLVDTESGPQKSGVTILDPPRFTSHTVSYGMSPQPVWAHRFEDAAQIALVVLLVWLGIQFLRALARGVRAAFAFLWWAITLPFRVARWVLVQAVRLPGRIARGLHLVQPAVVHAGHTVRGTYEAFAESFNDETARQQALERARAGMRKASEHLEAAGRHLGQRLSRLGLQPDESDATGDGPGFASTTFARSKGTSGAIPEFEGYKVKSEMPRGGSGARLFLAEPSASHARLMAERGIALPSRVVIKSFSLMSGAHMSGILREGRALDAARRLGQVFEHHSGEDGLFYVMPFVPGDTLDTYIARLHGLDQGASTGSQAPLDAKRLNDVLALQLDLLTELDRFHSNGLWHKDIKPANLIVNQGRLHVVDLGLLTPLASALTLTTHGTEYYRDPEMVRLAMRGAQVRNVDAAKFDIYSAGVVLFSMLEGTFPAHGNLSRLQRPCPPALGWIVRRAMAEHESRYATAREMREDLAFLLQHKNLDSVKPKHLPSWGKGSAEPMVEAVPSADPVQPTATKTRRKSWTWACRSGKGKGKQSSRKALVACLFLGAIIGMQKARQHRTGPWQNHAPVEAALAGPSPSPVSQARAQLASDRDPERLVQDLLQRTQPGGVTAVYVHGVDSSAAWHESLQAALDQASLKTMSDGGSEDPDSLALAASVARLLDGRAADETPDTGSLLEFFLKYPQVQAILDGSQAQGAEAPRWVVSPLAR